MFAATNSDKKPKLTIRAPRTNFMIKLVRYAYALRTLGFMFLFERNHLYSVFQSAEVQKLWVLGKRQEAEGKREEK